MEKDTGRIVPIYQQIVCYFNSVLQEIFNKQTTDRNSLQAFSCSVQPTSKNAENNDMSSRRRLSTPQRQKLTAAKIAFYAAPDKMIIQLRLSQMRSI